VVGVNGADNLKRLFILQGLAEFRAGGSDHGLSFVFAKVKR
jgi:hypothetical protein